MLRYLLRRVLLILPALFGLLVLTFLMLRVVPTDPAAALAGENSTVEQIEAIRKAYGFDRPLHEQFWVYLKQVLTGDFGTSLYTNRPVADDIRLFLPATIELTMLALAFASISGVLIGTLAAVWHNSAFDHLVRIVTVAGLAVASFWFAILLQMLFSMQLDWLPLRGRLSTGMPAPPSITGLFLFDSLVTGNFRIFLDALHHIVMPAFTLSLGGLATIARFTRSAVLDTMQKEFVTYETAVGYPRWRVIAIYVLRNSLVTPITQIGLLFGALISSAVAIEAIFDWPGVGSYMVQAIFTSDYKSILAVTLVVGVIYAVMNLCVDVVHALIDPRVAEQM